MNTEFDDQTSPNSTGKTRGSQYVISYRYYGERMWNHFESKTTHTKTKTKQSVDYKENGDNKLHKTYATWFEQLVWQKNLSEAWNRITSWNNDPGINSVEKYLTLRLETTQVMRARPCPEERQYALLYCLHVVRKAVYTLCKNKWAGFC